MKRWIGWFAAVIVLAIGTSSRAAVETRYDLDRPPVVGGEVEAAYLLDRPPISGPAGPVANPLEGVPEYIWWYGCSPTAGGMMVGYWDGQAGYENLFEGDASYWWGESNPAIGITGTRSMVAGTAHILAGGTWQGHDPDSLADFMRTEGGGTYDAWIRQGLEDYVKWDNPSTATDESGPGGSLSFAPQVELIDGPYFGGSFGYDDFTAEIDAGRPVLLNLMTYHYSVLGFVGHNVVGYGYQEDMFTLTWSLGLGSNNPVVTVPGVAVMDTWGNGTAQSDWAGPPPGYASIPSIIDSEGIEWWPFLEFGGASFISYWDWMVVGGITMDIAIVPEPASIVIWSLLGGLCVVAARRRRRKAAG